MTGLHPFDRVPELAAACLDRTRDNDHEGPAYRLPPVWEGRLRGRMINGAEALHATKVMDPVHRQDSIARAAAGWSRSSVGRASRVARSSSEELAMLTLTDSAVSAIRTLTSQPEQPGETGLRIMAQGDGGASSFQLALVDGPAAGDQVVEEGGARVFVEAAAAEVLEDKALDAQVNEQGDLAFRISEQAGG
jgi:Fe-S cluster assembly iron-binding protein IscA